MRELNHKEQGELDFWIDYVNSGCERETGTPFALEARKGARGRLDFYFKNISGPITTDGKVWVDVGSGPFSVLLESPEGITRIMIDPLMKHYSHYQLLQPNDDPARNIYLESSGEEIILVDACADAVFCTNTLDHVYDPFRMMKEMVRILRPEGILVIEVDIGGITDELHPHALEKETITSYLEGLGMKKIFEHTTNEGLRRPGATLFYGIYKCTERTREHFSVVPVPPRRSLKPVLALEGFLGFNIIKLSSRNETVYYGILQEDGAFLYSKIEEKKYKVYFEGTSLDEVEKGIEDYRKRR